MEADLQNKPVSFGFSKKTVNLPAKGKDFDGNQEKKELDFITVVEDKEVRSVNPVEPEKELIIAALPNKIGLASKISSLKNSAAGKFSVPLINPTASALDIQAVNEILKASNGEETKIVEDLTINLEANGEEGPLDVSEHAEQSTLDDYERIPVEAYGLALLKGMGWKQGEGIGKNKKNVQLKEVVLRPKGLGLGADSSVLQGKRKDAKTKDNEDELKVKKGANVCFDHGQYKGMYGEIEGLDGDEGRLFIRITITKKVVTVPEIFVHTVTKKEFKKESKVLNKDVIDKYKEKNALEFSEKRSNIDLTNGSEHLHSHKRKHKSSKHEHSPPKPKVSREDTIPNWVMPQLRVRFVDCDYKRGKYFNLKFVVEDVVSATECLCRDEKDKVIELPLKYLETVIPRNESAIVMVVRGKYKNQVGRIMKRDKAKNIATVHFLQERNSHKLDYDDICEYVGDVSNIE